MSVLTVREIYERGASGEIRMPSGKLVSDIRKHKHYYYLIAEEGERIKVGGLFVLYVNQMPVNFSTLDETRLKEISKAGRKAAHKGTCRTKAILSPQAEAELESHYLRRWTQWLLERS